MPRRALPAVITCLLAPALAGSSLLADITPHPGMLRQPAVSDSRIAFIYANQIWTAPRSGGAATLVAAPPVRPGLPRFSPDGKTIAFMANFDGNNDLYTVPVAGGELTRVTHHPTDEILCGWKDDKSLLFFARTMTDSGPARITRLYSVPATGGLPERLPMPYAGFGAVSHDGKTVAFTPLSTDERTWRRYRGGMAPDLWTMDLASGQSKRITDWEGTDTMPMWGFNRASGVVYYLSDNGPEHRLNIWSYDTASGNREQVTKFTDFDIRYPSIGPGPADARGKGEIIFQIGPRLMLLDLDSKESRAVEVTIPGARPRVRDRLVDAADLVTASDLSPSGKRVLLTGRGDVWSVPAKEGVTRNLTRTDGVFERDATWSPDGRWIAYLSDASGEYELCVRASDARPGEDDKPRAGAGEDDEALQTVPLPTDEVQLTHLGAGFRFNPIWSPDSKHVALTDKAGNLILVDVEFDEGKPARITGGSQRIVDTDPWSNQPSVAWSHDSSWICYTRSDEDNNNACLWMYRLSDQKKTRVTAPYFAAGSPAFDRKGEFLYYTAQSEFSSPRYSDVDTTFIYAGTQRLMMAPLRKDVKCPLAPRSDEEEVKGGKDEKKDDKKDERKDDKKDPAPAKPAQDKPSPDKPSGRPAERPAKPARRPDKPPRFEDAADEAGIEPGAEAGAVGLEPGAGLASVAAAGAIAQPIVKPMERSRTLVIDLANFESRAQALPVPPGNFGSLNVTDDGKLLYVRQTGGRRGGGGDGPSIKLLDPKDDKHEEQTVADNVGGYTLAAGGKKLLISRGGRWQVLEAQPGGGKAQDVSTAAMKKTLQPRAEWKQLFTDAWRLERDFFYVPNMHGLDWDKVRQQYGAMLDDAATREDVQFIIGEMISQLNIGHAYLGGPGDTESSAPAVGVGLLGCDFELATKRASGAAAYRFKKIYRGAAWDGDARSPLDQSEPEKDRIVEGEYLLAVNGVPVDTSRDPWAALTGMADKTVTLTVGIDPVMNGKEREVVVTCLNAGADQNLRFRDWIEANRAEVDRASEGKVGYIYVPNTGAEGQNELFRQFFAQRGRAALIIDDRWNGGGQIPNRFIELLNRPVTNYWARRDGKDWTWPPDSHQGPKCMLINGQAGSGGDMFPWLFKNLKIGKLVGQRTWGGLVGISGSPPLVDGGGVTVPSFGFYKKDGTWGIEGHGVDPDIEVIDDPGKMTEGGPKHDPQLAAAIAHMLEELKTHPYTPPERPAPPDRSGMGVPERDR